MDTNKIVVVVVAFVVIVIWYLGRFKGISTTSKARNLIPSPKKIAEGMEMFELSSPPEKFVSLEEKLITPLVFVDTRWIFIAKREQYN